VSINILNLTIKIFYLIPQNVPTTEIVFSSYLGGIFPVEVLRKTGANYFNLGALLTAVF
jgi:hypothetical protein